MLRFFFNFLLSIMVFGIISVVIVSWYIVPGLPDIETLKDVRMQVPLRVYSADSSLIAEFGEKRRTPIQIEDVQIKLIEAFLAAEDDRFYEHPGVDWHGIARAVYSLIKTGSKKQGGSTITMQVARNFFLSREKTYLRKLNEIFLSFKIERELSKNAILELYLNKIYLGQRAYGVAAAAQVYYGKDINSLNLAQIAMIAGLPKAPSTTNPIRNAERAMTRRNYVLQRMLTLSHITEEEYKEASESTISASLHTTTIDIEAPYIAEMVRSDLFDKQGDAIYNNGLIVTTTILDRNQNAANQALRNALLAYDKRHGYRGSEHHIDDIELKSEEDIAVLLESFSSLGKLYPALVTHVNEQSVSATISGIGQIEINWQDLEWARKYISENRRGTKPKTAGEILEAGDIIRVIETETGDWALSQIPDVEGGMVSLSPDDGAVLALVGGFDYYKNKFNRITQARRQPGSGFKPFIYSAAIESGKTASTLINDAPIVFDDPGVEDEWRPENYSHKSYGPTRIRVALTHSRNLVSIRLLHSIGVPYALEHIQNFGFDTDQLPHNLSLSLGSAEITPWQMARAYSVFANGGFLINPYFIDEIKTYSDEVLFKAEPLVVCNECAEKKPELSIDEEQLEENQLETLLEETLNEDSDESISAIIEEEINAEEIQYAPRVVNAQNIWITNSMTRDVIKHGTGRRALQLNRSDLSGKTGTTNDQHDAWFSGFNSNVVTIAWVGFDKFQPLGSRETGARAALPIWIDYMRVALDGMPESIMERPKGLVNVRIDPVSGQLANANNPDAIFEVFRIEHAPKSTAETKQPDIFLQESESSSIPEQLF
ncbi:MAG TPA: penicillin-binding protein 1A [Thiotrichaceae bacterium]|jgi:penicillin-binding protein 1A|nr:penicillin-binding protein 1A [Thiotrichaceae bacterium]HIM08948.1 penicillin-binding protein 1A [Gammaproteobacteria bacterium]